MAKISTLADKFAATNALWTYFGTAGVSGGQLQLVPTTAYDNKIDSVAAYDLTNSSLSVQIPAAPQGNGGIDTFVKLYDPSGSDEIYFLVEGGQLYMTETVAGVPSTTSITYDATAHARLQFRHDGTNLLFETSPDGTTYTTRRTKTPGRSWTSVHVQLLSGYFGTEPTPGVAVYDNLNVAPQSTIFGGQTPTTGNATDGVAYTMGTRFTPNIDGFATHGRWHFPSTPPSGTVSCGIYRNSDQQLLGSATFSSPTTGAWNTAAFSSPIALTAGVAYTAVIWTPDRYVATNSYAWPSGDGNVVSEDSAAGRFDTAGSPFVFPTSNANGCYFADVAFVADVSSSPAPAGIAIATAVGNASVALNRAAAPNGRAVAVSTGTPSVALNRTAAPAGLPVPVALGTPTVAVNRSAAPAGVAVPVALGQPAGPGLAITPAGVAITVTLGPPTAAIPGASPAGRAVTVALGSPSPVAPPETSAPGGALTTTSRTRVQSTSSGIQMLTTASGPHTL